MMQATDAIFMSRPQPRSSLSRSSSIRNLFVLAAALLSPVTVLAWTWELQPSVDTGVSYETNPDNVSEGSREDDAYIASLRGKLRVMAMTADSKLQIDPSVRLREDWDNDSSLQLDSTDFSLPLSFTTRGRRSETSVSAGFSLIPSREADYQVTDPNLPPPPGGVGCDVDNRGRCQVDEMQTYWHVGPSFSYDLTPRTQLSAQGRYTEVSYDEARITRRFDYDYSLASLSLLHMLHPRHKVNVAASFARYDARQPGSLLENKTDTTSVSVGYEYVFSAETSVNLNLGSSSNDYKATVYCINPAPPPLLTGCTREGNDDSFVGELFLVQKFPDRISTRIGVSRQVQPSSDGAQVTADNFTAFAERDLSPRLRVSAGISYIDQEAIGSESVTVRQRLDRSYARLDLGLRWQLSRHWFARVRYAYNTEDYDVRDDLVSSSSIDTRNQIVDVGVTWVGSTYR